MTTAARPRTAPPPDPRAAFRGLRARAPGAPAPKYDVFDGEPPAPAPRRAGGRNAAAYIQASTLRPGHERLGFPDLLLYKTAAGKVVVRRPKPAADDDED